jgi:hypothetical protein
VHEGHRKLAPGNGKTKVCENTHIVRACAATPAARRFHRDESGHSLYVFVIPPRGIVLALPILGGVLAIRRFFMMTRRRDHQRDPVTNRTHNEEERS